MLFNSPVYVLLFLPVVAGIYAVLCSRARDPIAQLWLLLASLFFYGHSRPANLLPLLASIGFNWATAHAMSQSRGQRRKLFLQLGLLGNIGALCYFKYTGFFFDSIVHGPSLILPALAPLGISFLTLAQVMYLADTYQGLNPPNSLLDHATFASLFPYVTSGPIVRARTIALQIRKGASPGTSVESVCAGLSLFGLGLFKKVILADSFAVIADAGFSSIRDYSMLEGWIFAFAFLFQLYFDFSGYSDMAVGSARILGIEIPQNFDAPLRARSVREFWQRWHISLSNFLTNYLYTPLLRMWPKANLYASVTAILITMAIAGLWHGPAWTFVLYGLSHGLALSINQVWTRRKLKMPDWLGWVLTQLFVAASLVFFRCSDVPSALRMLSSLIPHADLFDLSKLEAAVRLSPWTLAWPAAGVIAALFFKSSKQTMTDATEKPGRGGLWHSAWVRTTVYAVMLYLLLFFNSPMQSFIYGRF